MGKIRTIIVEEEEACYLEFLFPDDEIRLSLSTQDANEVRSVFARIVTKLMQGPFEFELESDRSDLYHFVSIEYLKQLNSELEDVWEEMIDDGIVVTDEGETDL
jgi:hypothetical protein